MLLPKKFIIDGNHDFIKSFVPMYLEKDLMIYDIGGGKNPHIKPDKKILVNATVVGLDINNEELNLAPEGSYDEIICADITSYLGNCDADIVICQAVLEHVYDTGKAISAIFSILKPGGLALVFVPSKNSIFARLNIIIPQSFKKKLLYKIYPKSKSTKGFPAYYDKCTPLKFRELAYNNNFSIIDERYYYIGSYFSFFFPVYLIWRLWVLLFFSIRKEQAAETFSMALRKNDIQL